MLAVKTIMERWERVRNVFIQVRAVNWIHLSGQGGGEGGRERRKEGGRKGSERGREKRESE